MLPSESFVRVASPRRIPVPDVNEGNGGRREEGLVLADVPHAQTTLGRAPDDELAIRRKSGCHDRHE